MRESTRLAYLNELAKAADAGRPEQVEAYTRLLQADREPENWWPDDRFRTEPPDRFLDAPWLWYDGWTGVDLASLPSATLPKRVWLATHQESPNARVTWPAATPGRRVMRFDTLSAAAWPLLSPEDRAALLTQAET
jgi:hypothetical protein